MKQVQWMYGDASMVGHSAAKMNPLRWSSRKNYEDTILELQRLASEERARPIEMRFFEGQAEGRYTSVTQHFRDAREALSRLTHFPDACEVPVRDEVATRVRSVSADSALSPSSVNAGILEKQSQWCKEWARRFFILRGDRIDYFLNPPEVLSEENIQQRRGVIPLSRARPAVGDRRPHCIQIGSELLSCTSALEQQAWITSINTAVAASTSSRSRADTLDVTEDFSHMVLMVPDSQPRILGWNEMQTVNLPHGHTSVVIVFYPRHELVGDPICNAGSDARAQAVCHVLLNAERASFPIHFLSDPTCHPTYGSRLCVHVARTKVDWTLIARVGFCFALAAALCLAGSTLLAVAALATAAVLAAPLAQGRGEANFAVTGLERGAAVADAGRPGAPGSPRWLGTWKLDKACSESYDPVLADLGVTWALRKAADAANSSMTISLTETSVKILLKIWVSVLEEIPFDGTWAGKPCPPGSRKIKGECRVRFARLTDDEIEMVTEFPDGNGQLRDTLTVHEDGESFTRVVVRGEIQVTRVFRKDHSAGR